ncbi:MAG: DUF4347 domain-containing protein [Desulfomonile tiedjei]|nr:DUF4347 domain-containing protein [Desulfomonile tiedjei]
MGLLFRNRARECRPEMIFEELEQRIVLDASVDPTIQGHQLSNTLTLSDLAHAAQPPVSSGAGPDAIAWTAGHAAPTGPELNVVLISDALPLQDLDAMRHAAAGHAKVLLYSDNHDSLDSINAVLKDVVETSGKKIDNLGIVGHAQAGQVWLAADKFDLVSAQSHRAGWANLGQNLADDAQIQLFGCDTAGNAVGQALVDRIAMYTQADVLASAHKTGQHHDWNLEYSSNPRVSQVDLFNASDLAGVTVELGTPLPAVTIIPVPPVTGGATVADLQGAVRINGDPTLEMHLVITANPRPLTSNGISSLSFSETTLFGITTFTPPTNTSGTQIWHMDGDYQSLNAVLATMQANLSSGFAGNAEIEITLTDPDHATDANVTPLVVQTLFVPVNAAAAGGGGAASSIATGFPVVTLPGAQTTAGDTPILFTGANAVQVTDADSHVIDVALRVHHGILAITPDPSVHILKRPAEHTAPDVGVFPIDATASWMYMTGPIPALNTTLSTLQYTRLAGWVGADRLDITADDRGFDPWKHNDVNQSVAGSIAITVNP